MGKYTCREDPAIDRLIEGHFQALIEAIRSHMVPDAIVLRGSFGRGEGSVFQENGEIVFLSDYEIDVAACSPKYRKLFKQLSQDLTSRFGVDTSLRWVRPDFLVKQRIGPLMIGAAPVTISMYESRYGSRFLWGEDFIHSGKEVDTANISLDSGINLVLNRMAETMYLMSSNSNDGSNGLSAYYWVNKTILACGEALLLLWGQYHYSYAERGRRFAELAPQKLTFFPDNGTLLAQLFARATLYKLVPDPDLYPESVDQAWQTAIPVIDLVFKHLVAEVFKISVDQDAEFPSRLLMGIEKYGKGIPTADLLAGKLLEGYYALRARSLPPATFSSHLIGNVVYAIIPFAFLNLKTIDHDILRTTRHWLKQLGPLEQQARDPIIERDYLQKMTALYWKIYCYG